MHLRVWEWIIFAFISFYKCAWEHNSGVEPFFTDWTTLTDSRPFSTTRFLTIAANAAVLFFAVLDVFNSFLSTRVYRWVFGVHELLCMLFYKVYSKLVSLVITFLSDCLCSVCIWYMNSLQTFWQCWNKPFFSNVRFCAHPSRRRASCLIGLRLP